ncbi:unnamed protein product [Adineta steineri]|uniref:Uncharacterized protein n=1 Tax=Adineta steineri TaxID=433720 RepID=A0A819L6A2_9BILA|nr:unnamed protein product [Adineta steineri]CAF1063407.1 unnamed protein product [Adineta steineri]CAF1402901.1 unnamed protein product [Adineta steineri]CAF3960990.1 unnamed protein product [Adineta steineri]
MNGCRDLGNDIIKSFCSAFWLEEKHWFVVITDAKTDWYHDKIILSTVSLYAPQYWDYNHPLKPRFTTAPSSFDFSRYINHLMLEFKAIGCGATERLKRTLDYITDDVVPEEELNFSLDNDCLQSYNLINVQTLELRDDSVSSPIPSTLESRPGTGFGKLPLQTARNYAFCDSSHHPTQSETRKLR